MKASNFLIMAACAALFAGCATVPPRELVDARSAYRSASEGPAQQLVPEQLQNAQTALNLAEKSFRDEYDSFKTRELASVARQKSEQAAALGLIAAARGRKERANEELVKQQEQTLRQDRQDLNDSELRTAAARAEIDRQVVVAAAKERADADARVLQAKNERAKEVLNDAEKRAAEQQAELDKEAAVKAANDRTSADLQEKQDAIRQGARDLKDSEQRTTEALASLSSLASLREETRGMVLTLSGSVLFESGKSVLMAAAQQKLDQVAKALLSIPAPKLTVEGHTDSQGTEGYNRELSQRRADAVSDYLVRKGYPAALIQSKGRGEGSPIAGNDSPEGRANNRRVEIVIERDAR